MARGDLFKRSLEAGTSFIGMTRERAESVVREWVDAGDMGRGRAQKAIEDLLDRSRKFTEELRSMVRREVGNQMTALGVVTRDDLARLEAKIDAVADRVAPAQPPSARRGPAPTGSTTKKATAKRTTTARRAAPVSKATTADEAAAGESGTGPET